MSHLPAIEIGCADIKDIRFDERLDINPSPAVTKIADLREPLPYPDASFEFVKGAAVIEHLTSAEQVRLVRELHRVLISHGVVWIQCPDLEWLIDSRATGVISEEWFQTQMSGGMRDIYDHHRGLLTAKELMRLFESYGFRTLQLLDGFAEAGSLDGLFEKM